MSTRRRQYPSAGFERALLTRAVVGYVGYRDVVSSEREREILDFLLCRRLCAVLGDIVVADADRLDNRQLVVLVVTRFIERYDLLMPLLAAVVVNKPAMYELRRVRQKRALLFLL